MPGLPERAEVKKRIIIRRWRVNGGCCTKCGIHKPTMFFFHDSKWGIFCSTKCFVKYHKVDRNKVEIVPVKYGR